MKIQINDKFLPIFDDHNQRYVVCVNGSGTGKSYTFSTYLIAKALESKKKILVIRQYYSSLKDSVFADLTSIVAKYNIQTKKINTQPLYVQFNNGSEIIFKGADDPEKLKSIANIEIIFIEEASELNVNTFLELDRRLRKAGVHCHFLIASNPCDPDSYLKKFFFDGEGAYKEKTLLLDNITYRDNVFNTSEFIQSLEDLKLVDERAYNIYTKGLWERTNKGLIFWKMFSSDNVIDKLDFNINIINTIYISFDFNTSPFCTAIIGVIDNEVFYIIKLITSTHPKNDTISLATSIKDFMFANKYIDKKIVITGDYSGLHKDTRSERNDYDIIKHILFDFNTEFILRPNASVVARKNYINNEFSLTKIKVLAKETLFIKEMNDTQEDVDGTILKNKIRDKKTGSVYEKNGHISDAFAYLIVNIKYNQFLAFNNKSAFKILRSGKNN